MTDDDFFTERFDDVVLLGANDVRLSFGEGSGSSIGPDETGRMVHTTYKIRADGTRYDEVVTPLAEDVTDADVINSFLGGPAVIPAYEDAEDRLAALGAPDPERAQAELDVDEPGIYWLSFVDPDLPEGSRFLGVSLVPARNMLQAIRRAHRHGCNPGDEVASQWIPEGAVEIPDAYLNRLLTVPQSRWIGEHDPDEWPPTPDEIEAAP